MKNGDSAKDSNSDGEENSNDGGVGGDGVENGNGVENGRDVENGGVFVCGVIKGGKNNAKPLATLNNPCNNPCHQAARLTHKIQVGFFMPISIIPA